MTNKTKVEHVLREIIDNQLLVASPGERKIPILVGEETLAILIHSLSAYGNALAAHADSRYGNVALLLNNLEELQQVSFGKKE